MRAGNFFLGAIIVSLAGYYGLRAISDRTPTLTSPEPPARSQSLLRGDALLVAQKAVQARLKAPASAEFGGTQIRQTHDLWEITGYVDSQNSFGATLRSTYRAKVIYRCMEVSHTACWHIDRLTISE